jgi:2,3-diketo-5-methylthio-1-phosphopentane phosphatase
VIFAIDFDGTLAVRDSVDALLESFADARWRQIEQDWLDGRITAVECMRRQLRLVKADRLTLETYFRSIQLDASFLPFLRHVRGFAEIAIISDGLAHSIATATRAANIPPLAIFANTLHFTPDGLDISFPHRDPACADGNGVCKCAIARKLAAAAEGPIVLIGDGKSDACLAAHAEIVFAKSSLAKHCQHAGIPFHPFQTFADVLRVVKGWPQPAREKHRNVAS